MKVSEVVGQRVHQGRKDRGISQAELGRRLGDYLERAWYPQAVSEAEKGRRNFSAEELLALAVVLDRPVSWFFIPPVKESFEFPSQTVSMDEMVDGPLLGGPEGNVSQALVEEGLAFAEMLERVRVETAERASAFIAVAYLAGKPKQ